MQKQDYTEWIKIKDSADFGSFYNFALNVNDTTLLHRCVDSLEKYKPTEPCIILRYYDYFDSDADSLIHGDFALEDQCGWYIDYLQRNLLKIIINRYDTVRVEYLGLRMDDYKKALFSLHDTTETTPYLPQVKMVNYQSQTYLERKLGTFIYAHMSPDSMGFKTSWKRLILVTKEVLQTINEVKDKKALVIFGSPYKDLIIEQKALIDELVPTFINIYFVDSTFFRIPPPPPACSPLSHD